MDQDILNLPARDRALASHHIGGFSQRVGTVKLVPGMTGRQSPRYASAFRGQDCV